MSGIHICLLAHSDSPWTAPYVRYLSSRGHRVSVVSFFPRPIEGEFYYVGHRAADGRLPKWIYVGRIWRVRRLLARLKPDVVLATYFRSNGMVASFAATCPLVVSSRGIDQDFPAWMGGAHMTRRIAGRANWIHVSSQELHDSLVAVGVPSSKITVLPLGTDPDRFVPAASPVASEAPRIVCTRKHHPVYDNVTIVRALSLLREEGFAFRATFVGTGTAIHRTIREVRDRGLEDVVEFKGEVPHALLPEFLNSGDLYVSASHSDGTSSALLEAMSCCLCPIVSDITGNRPWVAHRKNGFLFQVGNYKQCAEGLRWGWMNRKTLAPELLANRRMIQEKGNFHVNVASLERLLVSVARGQTSGV